MEMKLKGVKSTLNNRIIWSRPSQIKNNMIENVICNMIRHTKVMSGCYGWDGWKPGEIEVTFRLSVPKWINDKEIIKTDNQFIQYAIKRDKESKQVTKIYHKVFLKNVDQLYPSVGNNKFFCETRRYNIIDFINERKDVIFFLREERRKIFRELQMHIKLEEIGEKTRQWEALSNGTYDNNIKLNYGMSRVRPQPVEEKVPF